MKKLSITELQRNIGDISTLLIKGESIILTRNGKDFALVSPILPDGDTIIRGKPIDLGASGGGAPAEIRAKDVKVIKPLVTKDAGTPDVYHPETMAEKLARRAKENEAQW